MLWHRNCGNMPLSWERPGGTLNFQLPKGDDSDGLQTDYRGSELAAQAARGESREPALARYPANQCAAQADDAGLRAGQGPGRIFDHAQRPRRAGRPGTGNPIRLSFHAGIAVPRSGRFRAPRFSFAGRDAKRSRPEYAFRTENSTRGKRAMTSATKPQVRIAPNNPVFDLPVIVGIEEGLFAQAGFDVSFSATYADRERDNALTPFMSRLKEQQFDCGSADSYNVCEWASIDRLERGKRGGNIAALRASVAAQAIITFDDALQVPRDMADVPVVVQELTGSNYTTIQMLESAVGADHVKIENGGLPQMRYAALKNRTARAIAIMEPFISLGLKDGAHIIAASFYRGGEVIAPDLTAEQRKAYYDAENEAVDLINGDFYKYAHHVTAHAKGALQPRELLRAFVHYKHVDYYDATLFDRAYEWMKARGMTEGQSQHSRLVVS